MKLTYSQQWITTLSRLTEESNVKKVSYSLFVNGLILLLFSESLGALVDVSELIALGDSFILECLGVSFASLLLTNPIVVEQLWRLVCYIHKLLNDLLIHKQTPITHLAPTSSQVAVAHGCRAPPYFSQCL